MKVSFNRLINFYNEPHEKFLYNILLIFLFSIVYTTLHHFDKNTFKVMIQEQNSATKSYTYFDFLWFSLMSQFTMVQGNLYPLSTLSKCVIALQSGLFWFVNMA